MFCIAFSETVRLTSFRRPYRLRCGRSTRRVWCRFVASDYALNDSDNGIVPFGCRRSARRLYVRGDNIAEQISDILVIEDLCVAQGQEQGFADAEGRQTVDADRG